MSGNWARGRLLSRGSDRLALCVGVGLVGAGLVGGFDPPLRCACDNIGQQNKHKIDSHKREFRLIKRTLVSFIANYQRVTVLIDSATKRKPSTGLFAWGASLFR